MPFVVRVEAASIEPGESAAVIAGPKFAVVGGQHCHHDVVRQAVGFREHLDLAVFEADEPGSVGADPQSSIPIRVQGPSAHIRRQRLQSVSASSEYSSGHREPHVMVHVLDCVEATFSARGAGGLQLL